MGCWSKPLRSGEWSATLDPLASLRALLRILLLILGMWIFYLSLHPFAPVDSWSLYWERLSEGFGTIMPGRLSLHILAFILLGILLGLSSAAGQRIMGLNMTLLLPDFCLTIELLQAATTTRHPRLGDLLLNLFLAWIAHDLAIRIAKTKGGIAWLVLRANSMAKSLAITLLILFLVAPYIRSRSTSLVNWDESYALLMGDELGGQRPWSGQIGMVAVYSPAIEDEEARRLLCEGASELRKTLAPWLFFDLSAGTMQQRLKQRGRDSTLDHLSSNGAVITAKSVSLSNGAVLLSQSPPREFIEHAKKVGSFSLEVCLETAQLHQDGPARILSLSDGLYNRNFTLGQKDDALILRVRTPWNGLNGHSFQGAWQGIMIPGRHHHLLISYQQSQYRLYQDGIELLPRQDMGKGGLELTLLDLRSPLSVLLLILLPIGLILAWLFQGVLPETRRRAEAVLGLLLTVFYVVAGYLTGSEPELLALLFLVLCLPIGDLAGTWLVGKPQSNPRGQVLPNQDEVT